MGRRDCRGRSEFTKAEETFDGALLSSCHALFAISAGIRYSESRTRRQGNKVEKGQSSHVSCCLAPTVGQFTRAVVDHKTGRVDCRKDSFTVNEDLDGGLLSAEEAEGDFVKARSNCQDDALIFIPEEVLRACVHILDLPRHSVAIVAQLA